MMNPMDQTISMYMPHHHLEHKTFCSNTPPPFLNKVTFRCWFNKKSYSLQVQYYISIESHFGIELNEPWLHQEFREAVGRFF